MRVNIYFFILMIALFGSCKNRDVKHILSEFIDTRIEMPEGLKATYNGKDTVMTNFADSCVRLIVIYDSLQCGSCAINRLNEWGNIIEYSRQNASNFKVMFIFTPKLGDMHNIKISLMANAIDYPIFIDANNKIFDLNRNIPQDRKFHTFLIDKYGKVVIVGSPLNNIQLWNLYKGHISESL